jgi:hypothetical protein
MRALRARKELKTRLQEATIIHVCYNVRHSSFGYHDLRQHNPQRTLYREMLEVVDNFQRTPNCQMVPSIDQSRFNNCLLQAGRHQLALRAVPHRSSHSRDTLTESKKDE